MLDNSNCEDCVKSAFAERHVGHGSPNRTANVGEFDAAEKEGSLGI
jgi:hypothetical protein